MKKIFQVVFLAIFFVLLFACNKTEEKTLQTLDQLSGTQIGYFENNEFVFTVPEESILEAAKKIEAIEKAGAIPTNIAVEMINRKPYLRIYANNNSVSTLSLIQEQNGNARKPLPYFNIGTVACTSNYCYSGDGCVPDYPYCTPCIRQDANGQDVNECIRSTHF